MAIQDVMVENLGTGKEEELTVLLLLSIQRVGLDLSQINGYNQLIRKMIVHTRTVGYL
jgi:hypothetical protein